MPTPLELRIFCKFLTQFGMQETGLVVRCAITDNRIPPTLTNLRSPSAMSNYTFGAPARRVRKAKAKRGQGSPGSPDDQSPPPAQQNFKFGAVNAGRPVDAFQIPNAGSQPLSRQAFGQSAGANPTFPGR